MYTLTICFYEHPAALGEIEFWESQMGDKIVSKQREEPFITFVIGQPHPSEFLVCVPLNIFEVRGVSQEELQSEILKLAHKNLESSIFSKAKFLIFGRVQISELDEVRRCMCMKWV